MKSILIFFINFLIISLSFYSPIFAHENQTYNYVIITTNSIKLESQRLNDFIQHKENLGFNVLVITEDDYNHLEGEYPNKRSEKIRQWLINNYQEYGIEYVLLIGDPTPDTEEGLSHLENVTPYSIPMKTFRDRLNTGLFTILFWLLLESPSDYYYADLDSDWNKVTKQYAGDCIDYALGINAEAEVYVGRIPTYNNSIDGLDDILQKTIEYENNKNISWRKSGLFVTSFVHYVYDDASLWEQVIDDFFKPSNFTYWRQYQQGSFHKMMNSIYQSEEELRNGSFIQRYQNDTFGIVAIMAHGSDDATMIGTPLYGYDGSIITVEQSSMLGNDHPSIIFLNSCKTGYPEHPNLGYSLLKNGGIAVICASRTLWCNAGIDFDKDISSGGIFYRLIGKTVQNYPIGKALYLAKNEIDDMISLKLWNYKEFMNLLRINIYGDPSINLL